MAVDHPSLPRAAIVTPCRNAARYIAETIESVLAQDYPAIDYLVVDGCSTDGTLDIVRRYASRLRYLSEADRGPADAINKGFRATQGEYFAFLNADDRYVRPDAVRLAVERLEQEPDAAAVYGDAVWTDAEGRELGPYPVADFDPERLRSECFIAQPATLFRRAALEKAGLLDSSLRYAFDYDLWIRLTRGARLVRLPVRMASSRMHTGSISLGSRRAVFRETIELLRKHYGYVPFRWVHGYCSFLIDGRDQFYEPLQPSLSKYVASLPAGLYYNRRHPLRYLDEWRRVMSAAALKRRIDAKLSRR